MTWTATLLALWCSTPTTTELPAVARHLHEEALAALERGELARADTLVRSAYAEVDDEPNDALVHRAGRDLLLSTRRVVLRRLSLATDDHAPLCELRAFLVRHRDELARALGEEARPPDTEGVERRIREVDESLARRAAEGKPADCSAAARPESSAGAIAAPAPASPPPERPAVTIAAPSLRGAPAGGPDRARRLRIAGISALASSLIPLSVMTYALVRHGRDYRGLRAIGAATEAEMRAARPDEVMLAEALYRDGVVSRAVSIAAGCVGALLLYSGSALLVRAKRLRRLEAGRTRLTPSPAGLTWSGTF